MKTPRNIRKAIISVVLLLLILHERAAAQTQYLGWLADFNTVKVGRKTSIHSDFQLRSSDELAHTQTLLLRAGLNVAVKKNIIITGGYAYVHGRRTVSGISGYLPEHRAWEQLIVNHKIKRALVSHRFRVEQRFIARGVVLNGKVKQHGHGYASRARYFIRNMLPLRKQATFVKGPFAALQNELFMNFGSTRHVNGKAFDQNRLYLATGYRLQPGLDLELGYMNQYISGATSRTNNHIAQLAMYLRI